MADSKEEKPIIAALKIILAALVAIIGAYTAYVGFKTKETELKIAEAKADNYQRRFEELEQKLEVLNKKGQKPLEEDNSVVQNSPSPHNQKSIEDAIPEQRISLKNTDGNIKENNFIDSTIDKKDELNKVRKISTSIKKPIAISKDFYLPLDSKEALVIDNSIEISLLEYLPPSYPPIFRISDTRIDLPTGKYFSVKDENGIPCILKNLGIIENKFHFRLTYN